MHLGTLHGATAQCYSKGFQSTATALRSFAQCVSGPIRFGQVRRAVMFDDDVTGIATTLRSRREDHAMQLFLAARSHRELDVVRIVEQVSDMTEEGVIGSSEIHEACS